MPGVLVMVTVKSVGSVIPFADKDLGVMELEFDKNSSRSGFKKLESLFFKSTGICAEEIVEGCKRWKNKNKNTSGGINVARMIIFFMEGKELGLVPWLVLVLSVSWYLWGLACDKE